MSAYEGWHARPPASRAAQSAKAGTDAIKVEGRNILDDSWVGQKEVVSEEGGATVTDFRLKLHFGDDSTTMYYVPIDRAKEVLGDFAFFTFCSRASQYNPEREILFNFWDPKAETATPRTLSESPDGKPFIDTDAVWCSKERDCPKCGMTFTSIGDRGQCPKCTYLFFASATFNQR